MLPQDPSPIGPGARRGSPVTAALGRAVPGLPGRADRPGPVLRRCSRPTRSASCGGGPPWTARPCSTSGAAPGTSPTRSPRPAPGTPVSSPTPASSTARGASSGQPVRGLRAGAPGGGRHASTSAYSSNVLEHVRTPDDGRRDGPGHPRPAAPSSCPGRRGCRPGAGTRLRPGTTSADTGPPTATPGSTATGPRTTSGRSLFACSVAPMRPAGRARGATGGPGASTSRPLPPVVGAVGRAGARAPRGRRAGTSSSCCASAVSDSRPPTTRLGRAVGATGCGRALFLVALALVQRPG